jgi:hypothetical protein
VSQLVADCPRCRAQRIAFEIVSCVIVGKTYDWQSHWEAFCLCGHCHKTTVFCLKQLEPQHAGVLLGPNGLVGVKGAVNAYVGIKGFISSKDKATIQAPEHLPENVKAAFDEGALCMAVGCFNAGGTMFRLCLDMATKSLLPVENADGLNSKIRRNLGFRLIWLFDNNLLPNALKDLAACVKEDGNDGAHEGTLERADAEDLLDFTVAVLERLYTEPERLRLAAERRTERRQGIV